MKGESKADILGKQKSNYNNDIDNNNGDNSDDRITMAIAMAITKLIINK